MASKAQDPGSGRRGGLFDSVKVLAGILALLLNIKAFKPQIEKESIFKSIAGSVLNSPRVLFPAACGVRKASDSFGRYPDRLRRGSSLAICTPFLYCKAMAFLIN